MPGASDEWPPRKARRGAAVTRATRQQRVEPRLPHERDQSGDSQQRARDEHLERAASDVERGLMDTGRAPVVDELARRHFPGRRGDQPKRR